MISRKTPFIPLHMSLCCLCPFWYFHDSHRGYASKDIRGIWLVLYDGRNGHSGGFGWIFSIELPCWNSLPLPGAPLLISLSLILICCGLNLRQDTYSMAQYDALFYNWSRPGWNRNCSRLGCTPHGRSWGWKSYEPDAWCFFDWSRSRTTSNSDIDQCQSGMDARLSNYGCIIPWYCDFHAIHAF